MLNSPPLHQLVPEHATRTSHKPSEQNIIWKIQFVPLLDQFKSFQKFDTVLYTEQFYDTPNWDFAKHNIWIKKVASQRDTFSIKYAVSPVENVENSLMYEFVEYLRRYEPTVYADLEAKKLFKHFQQTAFDIHDSFELHPATITNTSKWTEEQAQIAYEKQFPEADMKQMDIAMQQLSDLEKSASKE
mmetsp:Transcript_5668/g.7931  ORF Transcript_5668/g.7931 Transcript_5668/m.7931 type:complete len:187 (+) Transcript_5668:179-739(+)